MKRVKYYIPVVILLIYNIIYIPLLNWLKNNKFDGYTSPHSKAMTYMNIISIIVIFITVIYKLIMRRRIKGIYQNEKIINVILILGLIMGIIFFTILNMVI
jgi:hypothetical protein